MTPLEKTLADPYAQAFPENLPFWEAAAADEFVLPYCRQCGQTHWHPRAICPVCRSNDLAWRQASGRGQVYSYSIVRRPPTAYVLAYVQIDEGPILMTNIVNCDIDAVYIGMPVEVTFRPTRQGRKAPVFRPIS